MTHGEMMKKILLTLILTIIFILLINWITDFRFLHLEDLRLFVVLILGTTIFMLLHKDKQDLTARFRFYLFLTAFLMTLLMLYNGLLSNINNPYQGLLESLRPLIYATLLYFPGNIVIRQSLVTPEENLPPWQSLLSRRETEVYELVQEGKNNREISNALYIAETTVKKHVQNIMKKAGHSDRDRL